MIIQVPFGFSGASFNIGKRQILMTGEDAFHTALELITDKLARPLADTRHPHESFAKIDKKIEEAKGEFLRLFRKLGAQKVEKKGEWTSYSHKALAFRIYGEGAKSGIFHRASLGAKVSGHKPPKAVLREARFTIHSTFPIPQILLNGTPHHLQYPGDLPKTADVLLGLISQDAERSVRRSRYDENREDLQKAYQAQNNQILKLMNDFRFKSNEARQPVTVIAAFLMNAAALGTLYGINQRLAWEVHLNLSHRGVVKNSGN